MFTLNLLTWKTTRRLAKSPWFPVSIQAGVLIVMVALAINGWGVGTQIQDKALMILRKTSLTTLAVWGLWWPGMIGLAILAGRLWCTVCPMELVSRISHAFAERLGLRRFVLGPWLRGGWLALGAYVVLQLMVAGLAIHRVPHYTSILLLVLGILALGAGLLFREERAFCKAFCPA